MPRFPSRWIPFAASVWAAGAGVGPATAEDAQVNSYTTGLQQRPSVSLDADGDFVVVWESYGSGGNDSSGSSVQGQRYASDGSVVGGQFQVNSYTTSFQRYPDVALAADGGFLVVWSSSASGDTDASSYSVQGRRYASDGSPAGDQFQVNVYTTSHQNRPVVAVDADGDFVVVWESYGSSGTDSSSYSVQGRRYASDGSAVGGQFQVNTYTTSGQLDPCVSVDADGDFVVVWESYGSGGTDTSSASVQGQRYASDGSPAGGELQVNTYSTHSQLYPSVSLDADGDFVVVWSGVGSVGNDPGESIQGQRYASDGATTGGQFQVNAYTTEPQTRPSVSLDADGDFVVVWDSLGSAGTDSSSFSVQGRRYASDGSAVGGQFQVNTYTTSGQTSGAVSLDAAGDFVLVWASQGSGGTDSSNASIQRTGSRVFADGFESGDISAWSSANP